MNAEITTQCRVGESMASDYYEHAAECPQCEAHEAAKRPAAPPVGATLENISAVARRALSFGHQATPQTPERMIERKDEALRRIHELTGVSGSVLRAAPPVGEAERLAWADFLTTWVDYNHGKGESTRAWEEFQEERRAALASPAPQPAKDCRNCETCCPECDDAPTPVEPPPAEQPFWCDKQGNVEMARCLKPMGHAGECLVPPAKEKE